MGKYMRKAKLTGEVAVMEVAQSTLGVRTRAKTLALQRLQNIASSASYLQLRSRRLEKPPLVVASAATEARKTKEAAIRVSCSENSRSVKSVSVSHLKKKNESEEAVPSESLAENEVAVEASCGENVLESDGRERNIRETTPSSLIRNSETLGTPGSTTKPSASTSANRRTRNSVHRDIPTTHEMEEFFAGAEQEQSRIFIQKYNYDPVNDLPLPGRYEWVRLDL